MQLKAEVPLPQVERLKSSPVLRHLKANPITGNGPASDTLKSMYVPQGFKVELIASEPVVRQPIAFAFDERGRIWVAEAFSYPERQPEGEGKDRLIILSDENGDGTFETRKVFVENLNLVSGFEVGHGGVWVGAAPHLMFIPDGNKDDKPDGPPKILLEGFGYQDTHECLNSFLWGTDGWLYGIQGVFNYAQIGKPGAPKEERLELRAGVWRYHPVKHKFEIFAHGGSNPWGLDYDERGQLFMTHCRSYWGRGGTTHVIQNGHFWNQANANYAPFIIGNPPADFPHFRNYLLASARYDHGAGGAGAPGTDAIYGGHSHVGTMIYLGDNWPDVFRGKLFTHNLHGHQINQQANRRWGSGFDTVHAGLDQFFCSDPKYVAVDLQYGPDGAVYIIDWYDQQHCHNPNSERWERGSGRIYRMQWTNSFKPAKVNLANSSGEELVKYLSHRNHWYSRTAQRLLHEQPEKAKLAQGLLFELLRSRSAEQRLKALWALHLSGQFTPKLLFESIMDPDEYVRAWAIQLAAESGTVELSVADRFEQLAVSDPSPVVRLYLASAAQRVQPELGWKLVEHLAQHGADREDRNIPYLLWQSLATLMQKDISRGLAVGEKSLLPQLRDWSYWFAATLDDRGLEKTVGRLTTSQGEDQRAMLAVMQLALERRPDARPPGGWKEAAPALYQSKDLRVARQAQLIGARFGDTSFFSSLREVLGNMSSPTDARQHAFKVLSAAKDKSSLGTFIKLLDEKTFRLPVINLFANFDRSEIYAELISRFNTLSQEEQNAALNVLSAKPSAASAFLSAVEQGKIKRTQVSSFFIRQLTQLGDAEVNRRVEALWGQIKQSPADKAAQIAKLEKTFSEAPLWAFDARAGRAHFQKLCAQCHKLNQEGQRLGPELTGAGRNGIRYYLENIIDPNAVVGTDYQMTTVETKDDTLLSGIIMEETQEALTIRTATGETIVAKSNISKRNTSELSMMPEGLLDALNERERIELLKFLTAN